MKPAKSLIALCAGSFPFVIKWEFDQDLWGVALEFANGDRHNYCVGSYKEAMREMLRVLKLAEHATGALGL